MFSTLPAEFATDARAATRETKQRRRCRGLRAARRICLPLLLIPLLASATPIAEPAPPDVILALRWQDYLRLIPLSRHGDPRPVVLADSAGATVLADLLGSAVTVVDSAAVDRLVAATWPDTEAGVRTAADRMTATVAAAIAASLDVPLDLSNPPAGEAVIVVRTLDAGQPPAPLPDLATALAYQDRLADRTNVVLFGDDDFAPLAAALAAHHRSALRPAVDAAVGDRPGSLTWVTDPRQVTVEAMQHLYRAAGFRDAGTQYEPAIGVITAQSPAAASALLARTFCYARLRGEWRRRLADCNTAGPVGSRVFREGPWQIREATGAAVTPELLRELITSCGLVNLCAHGSPSGFDLSGFGWPTDEPLPSLPPLVFVAESCDTGDITGEGIRNSVALRLIGAGAVAYVGSMEVGGVATVGDYPFSRCTPGCPIGEHVRLQSAGRMDAIDVWPHDLLIGDPLFHQSAIERVEYTVAPDRHGAVVTLSGARDSLTTAIAVDLPPGLSVEYAVADVGDRRVRYARGLQFGETFSSARSPDHLRVLLPWSADAGTLTLYPSPPWTARLLAIAAGGLMGVDMILVQIPTMDSSANGIILGFTAIVLGLAAVRVGRRVERRAACVRVALMTAVGVGVVVMLDLGWQRQGVLMAIALGGGAAAVVMLLDLHRAGPRRLVAGAGLFGAPALPALMIGSLARLPGKGIAMLAGGVGLLALVFLLVVVVAWRVGRVRDT